MWDFFGIQAHTPYTQVLAERTMPAAKWFEGSTLNYAEHLLAFARRPDAATRPALIFRSECAPRTEVSWSALAGQTGALGELLDQIGIQPGDRIGSYMPNIPQTVAAMLATTSRGAIWSSCSPDMGSTSVLDRFKQIAPRALFAVDGYRYSGKDHDRRDLVRELVAGLPSVEVVIFVRYLNPGADLTLPAVPDRHTRVVEYADVVAVPTAPRFVPVAFDHPLWIVYSSGTTGMPKPIVHGHGGTVIESLKGTVLHLDVDERDRFFWFSSTGWIMWNLWVSTLATGCTALQFDGNPGHPDLTTLWRFMAEEKATFMGISPAFIGLNMKAGLDPRGQFDLSSSAYGGCHGLTAHRGGLPLDLHPRECGRDACIHLRRY
jgi:acetoacetyl-CoA synthetase